MVPGSVDAGAADRLGGEDRRGDAGLHVAGAAAVDPAVAHQAAERIDRPAVAGRHHVEVAVQVHQRVRVAAGAPADDVDARMRGACARGGRRRRRSATSKSNARSALADEARAVSYSSPGGLTVGMRIRSAVKATISSRGRVDAPAETRRTTCGMQGHARSHLGSTRRLVHSRPYPVTSRSRSLRGPSRSLPCRSSVAVPLARRRAALALPRGPGARGLRRRRHVAHADGGRPRSRAAHRRRRPARSGIDHAHRAADRLHGDPRRRRRRRRRRVAARRRARHARDRPARSGQHGRQGERDRAVGRQRLRPRRGDRRGALARGTRHRLGRAHRQGADRAGGDPVRPAGGRQPEDPARRPTAATRPPRRPPAARCRKASSAPAPAPPWASRAARAAR